MVASVIKKCPLVVLKTPEQNIQQVPLAKLPELSSFSTTNGLSNRAQHPCVPKGRAAKDAVTTQPKNNALAQYINPLTHCINMRAVTMFNTAKHPATVSSAHDKGQYTHTEKFAQTRTPQQKIMASLALEAEHQANKRHLLKPSAEKRSTRSAISKPIISKPPTNNPATIPTANIVSREMLTNAKAIVDSAIREFGIVEKSVSDPKYASQTIDSALCAIYSTHKDNFLKRLEQSAKPIQNTLFNTLGDDTALEIRQVISRGQSTQPQQAHTKIFGMLDKLERTKNTPFVKAFGAKKVINLLQKGIVKIAGRSLFKSSLQETVATAYQKGRNASLATGSLKALDTVTVEITQHQRVFAEPRAGGMPYPHTALETVTHEAVLKHFLKTKGHMRDDGNALSTAAQIAYHKGLCDGLRNNYLHTLGNAAQEAGLSGNAPHSDKAFTPTGAGANPFIRPTLDAVTQQYPDALMNPEIKEQLSKHAHNRLMAEIETLSRNLKPKLESMPSSDIDNDPALKAKLQNLMKYSPDRFEDNLAKISTRFEGFISY